MCVIITNWFLSNKKGSNVFLVLITDENIQFRNTLR